MNLPPSLKDGLKIRKKRDLLVRKVHLLSVGFQELVLQHSFKVGGPRQDILMSSKQAPLMTNNDGHDGTRDGAIIRSVTE